MSASVRVRRALRSVAAAAAAVTVLAACSSTPGTSTEADGTDGTGEATSTETDEGEAPGDDVDETLPALADPLGADELSTYGGVARLSAASDCTATLIETGVDDAPAYLLTAGHCIGLDGEPANRTVVDEEGYGEARFFDVAGADEDAVVTVEVKRFEYGTMRGTDIAILQLDTTLGELRAGGAVPLPIAAEAPSEGLDVVNIAAPVDGVAEGEMVLRKGECSLGVTTDVLEFTWLWLDAVANDCPGVRGGSSGSPLISDGEVVSVVNTTNTGVPAERGDTCYLGQPCEVSGDEATFVAETSYGVDIAGVGACFADGVFSLEAEGCPLVTTELWNINGGGIYGLEGVDSAGRPAVLELNESIPKDFLLVTNLPIGAGATCTDPATYANAEHVDQAALEAERDAGTAQEDSAAQDDGEVEWVEPVTVQIDLPDENGFVLACAAIPGQEAAAARFTFTIDGIAPTAPPQLSVQAFSGDDTGDQVMVDPLFEIPDIADISYAFGPADSFTCPAEDELEMYLRMSIWIEDTDLPARFCVVGRDMAGNASPMGSYLIDADGTATLEK